MTIENLFEIFGENAETQKMAIFASVFIIQNRLQTTCDELETDITMKQWLLLAMTSVFPVPPTLTAVGKLMGCSRQNIKKLAASLEKKDFLHIEQNSKKASAVSIVLDKKTQEYVENTNQLHDEVLRLLFQDFNDEEIALFYEYLKKLYNGLERIDKLSGRRKSK